MTTIADRLRELGLVLPAAPAPAANYVPAVRAGTLLFIAGQIGQPEGLPAGRIGAELSPEDGRRAAEAAALAVLAQVAAATGGRLADVARVARLGVFVVAAPDFTALPQVANGASDLVAAVFGEAGRHSRTTVGVAALPRGAAVEVDAVIELAR